MICKTLLQIGFTSIIRVLTNIQSLLVKGIKYYVVREKKHYAEKNSYFDENGLEKKYVVFNRV